MAKAMARVFLVEDNENLRESVSSYLSLIDLEVLEFGRFDGPLYRLGLPASLVVSTLFALAFSGSLAGPASSVARGLDRNAPGKLKTEIPEQRAEELAGIARPANQLARQLQREQEVRRQ